jgi:hypothetical protein
MKRAASSSRPRALADAGALKREEKGMSDKATVSTSVDTFNDGGSYFVRTEIEARLVSIHGPFPDLDTAKKLQAEQAAYVKSAGEEFKEQLQSTASGSPAGKASG